MKHKFSFNLKSRFVILLIGLLTMSATSAWGGSSLILTNASAPSSYNTITSTYQTCDNFKILFYNVGNFSSSIQFKKNAGYIQNHDSLPGDVTSIVIEGATTLKVYGGTSEGPSTEIAGSNGTYSFSGQSYKYFKIAEKTNNTLKPTKITINYSSGTPLGTPEGLNVISKTHSTANLSWNTVTDAGSYKVEYKVSNASSWSSKTVTTKSCELTGLSASTTYAWQVTAIPTDDAKTAGKSDSKAASGDNFTTNAPPKYGVNWSVNGVVIKTDSVAEGSAITFNAPTSGIPTGKTFTGWSASTISGTQQTAPTYVTSATMGQNDVTYYAVFATQTGDPTKYIRVTSMDEFTDGLSVVLVSSKYSTALTTTPGYATAPTETSSKITPTDAMKWTLAASDSKWKLKSGNSTLGSASIPTSGSKAISLTSSNSDWTIGENTSTENTFYFSNGTKCGLEAPSATANWVVYFNTSVSTNNYYAIKVYKPAGSYSDYCTSATASHSVTLNTNGGTIADGKNVTSYSEGTAKALPTASDITKTGNTFQGWFDNSSCEGTAITQIPSTATTDVEYWAKWQVNSYTLTWTINGGTIITEGTAAGSVQYGATLTAPILEKTGHNYSWNPEVPSTMPASDATYEAIWTAQQYNISYQDQGGADFSGTHGANYPTTHTYGTATTLVSPTKTHYTFSGWYGNSECSGDALTSIPADGYTADFTLYAKWAIEPKYTATFYVNGEVYGTAVEYFAGESVVFPANPEAPTPCSDKVFTGWTNEANKDYKSETTAPTYVTSATMGTEAVNFYAVFADADGDPDNFKKGSVSDLVDGQIVVIHDYTNNKVLTTKDYSTQKIPSASLTPTENKIHVSSITDQMRWTVGVNNGKYTFKQSTNYLMAANSYLKFGTSPQTLWTLTEVTNGYKFSQTDQSSYPFINYSSSMYDIASSSYATLNVFVPSVIYTNFTTTCKACENQITITKGEESANGTYTLSKTGVVCLDDVQGGYSVTITAVPAEHYQFASVTTTSGATGAIENNQCVISGITGDATITAVFEEKAKVTVKFMNNGEEVSSKPVYVGEAIGELPTQTLTACDDSSTTFIGWTAAEITVKQEDQPALISEETVISEYSAEPVIYNALWAKNEGVASSNYAKITSMDALTDNNYVFAYDYNGGTQIVMKNYSSTSGKIDGYNLSLSSSKYANPDAAYIWRINKVVDGSNTYYTLYNNSVSKYASANSSGVSLTDAACNYIVTWDNSNSCFRFQPKDASTYYLCGYVSGSTYYFQSSTSGGGDRYHVHLYKNESTTSYTEYLTKCCTKWTAPAFDYETKTIAVGAGTLTPTIGAGTTHGALSFVSSDTTIAKVNVSTGVLTPVKPGEVYVVATWEGADGYCAASDTSSMITVTGTLTIQFYKNGEDVTGTMENQEVTYNQATKLKKNTYARTGYTFDGWKEQGGTTTYDDEQVVTFTTDMKLDAQWTINQHSVSFTNVYTGGTITVNGSATSPVADIDYNSEVTIAVTENTHYHLTALSYKIGEAAPVEISLETKKFNMPDADVTVMATFTEDTKRTVTWYAGKTSSTTENVYDGTLFSALTAPEVDDDAAGDCADKFMGWATEAITTPLDEAGFNAIKVNETTAVSESQDAFYAVFASASSAGAAAVNTVLWGENFAHFGTSNPSVAGIGSGTTKYGNDTIIYSQNDDGTKAYAETSAGGTSPELLLKSGKTWTISGIKTGKAKAMALSFLSNKTTFAVTTTSSDIEVSGEAKAWTFTVKAGKVVESFDITIKNTGSNNARIDDVTLKVSESGVSYSDYITKCCDKLAAPASIEATDKTSSSLTFSWGTVANATGYQYKIDNAEWSEVQSTTTATATGLVENQIIHVLARGVYSGSENYCAEGDTAVANLKLVTVVKQPDTIVVTTNPTKMVYAVGESFDPTGMAVKVTYNTGETSTDVAYTYSPTTAFTEAGEQTITIRYSLNEKEVQTTLDVTVKNKYTVEWKVNGTTTSTTADVLDGTLYSELTKPANPEATAFAACEANTFMGWATAAVTKEGATADDVAFAEDDTEITNDVHIFYAVFAKQQTSQKVAKTVDLVASDGAYNTTNKDITFTALNGKITLTQIKATSSTEVNKDYYKKGTDSNRPRVYNGQTIKIEGHNGFQFSQVVIGHNSNKYGASLTANTTIADDGSVTDNTLAVTKTTTTVSDSSQTFALAAEGDSLFIQNGGSTQWHLKSVVVSYMDGGETEYVNYMTTCKTATKLDVKTAPTKVDYTEEETLDLTGLELTVTYDDESSETITSGYTSDPENGAVLSNETEVTLSYKGQECKQAITVTPLTRSTISATAPVGGSYTVKVGDAEAQTITEATNITEVKAGRTITLTTTASEHYKLAATPFVVKDADDADVELTKSGSNYTFTMPAKNVTISAQYVQLFTITKADVTGGTLTIKDNVTEAAEGTSIIVNATAAAGNELTALYYIKQGEETQNNIDLTTKTFNMVASNITVYATFTAKSYTITLNNKGVETQVTDLTYNETYTFEPGTTCPEYEFFGWSETAPEEGAWTDKPAVVTEYKVVEDKTFYAVYRQAGEPTLGNNYLLVNGSEDFESGKNYIITTISGEDEYAMSNSFTAAYHSSYVYAQFAATKVTPVNNVIQGTAATIWQLTGDATNGYTIYNTDAGKYVGADYSEQDLAFTADAGYAIPFTITFPNENDPKPTVDVSFYQTYVGTSSNSNYLTRYAGDNAFELDNTVGENYLYKQQYDTAFTYLAVPSCKELASVEVLTAPDKVNYKAGEDFDKTGLSLTATFTDASEELVEEDNIVIEGAEALAMSATEVTAKYTYDNITKSTSVAINMIELKSIAMNSASAHKTDYKVGQTFNPKNLIIDAHYNTTGGTLAEDVIEQVTEGFTYEPTTGLVEGENTITISYQGKTTTTTVNATPASPATVIFAASNESQYMETETSVGAGVKVPSVNDCDDYTFLGWSETEITTTSATQPELITVAEGRYYPEEDMILYPVYKGLDGGDVYNLVTDLSTISSGDKVMFYNAYQTYFIAASSDDTYACTKTTQNVPDNHSSVTLVDANTAWTVSVSDGNYQFYQGSKYLGVATYAETGSSVNLTLNSTHATWQVTASTSNNGYFTLNQASSSQGYRHQVNYYSKAEHWSLFHNNGDDNYNKSFRIFKQGGSVIYTSAPSTCTVEVEQNTVMLFAGNGTIDEDEYTVLKGESVTLPTPEFDCNGWSFMGWSDTELKREQGTEPSYVDNSITPTKDTMLYAIYRRAESQVASGYVYKTPASCKTMVTITPASGNYTEAQTLTMTAGDGVQHIYYTDNNTYPMKADGTKATNAKEYTESITIKDNDTIIAYAVYADGNSDFSFAKHTFTKPDAPTFNVAAGNVVENTTVTISSAEGTNVMYKIGDAEYVTAETNSYTYTFATLGAVTIKAKATKDGLESAEESRAYTVVAKPYTVTFNAGAGLIDGESTKEITETAQGQGVKLPVPTVPCTEDTWVFYGWSETNQTEDVTTAPALVPYKDYGSYKQYYPSADITLYAIYAKKQGGTILLEESCATFATGADKNFVSSTNTYTSDGKRNGGVRLGSSGGVGSMKSKAINIPVGSAVKITFDYMGWDDQKYANIKVSETSDNTVTYTGSNYSSSYAVEQSVALTTTTENPQFTFATVNNTDNRSFLRNIVISMGEVTAHYQTAPVCCVNSVVYNVGEGGVAIDPVKVPCNTGKFITLPKAEKLNCEFIKWTMGGNDYAAGDVYQYAASQSGDVEFVAVFGEPVTEITIEDDQDVKASDVLPSGFNGKLIVKDGAIITMDQPFSIGDFVIESSIGTSGQVKGATNLTITGDAYMELTIDTAAAGASFGWYAFTVPFPVSGSAGIYYGDKKLQAEKDYSVMKYLGDVRAQGKYGWKKCQGETLQPGVFYLLAVADTDYKTLRFHLLKSGDSYTIEAAATKPDGTSNSCRTNISKYAASGSGEATDAGWNGVGNKTLEYVGVTYNAKIGNYVQTYSHTTNAYSTNSINNNTFSVGKAFFVQSSGDGDFSFNSTVHDTILAPARRMAVIDEDIRVSLSNSAYTDNLFISASEEALPEYQIARDLAKMSMDGEVKVPQLASVNYGTKLCVEYAPLANDEATYQLSLFAPQTGEYTIAATQVEGCELFLTNNGIIIWNLSMNDYTIDLTKGNTDTYGLVLKVDHKLPTDVQMPNAQGTMQGVQKFIYDERLIIIRDGKVYNGAGALMK